MKFTEKLLLVVSIIGAAGVFGICSIIFDNPDVPQALRIIAEVFATLNLICIMYHNMGLTKRSKKK